MLYRIVVFLILNFAALAIGGLFTKVGVPSDWYVNLNKAPWTPPGWVFGAAWTTIMVCFSFFMANAWKATDQMKFLVGLYVLQWLLNVAWNPVFFAQHQVLLGLFVISGLTILVGFLGIYYRSVLGWKTMLIAPYFVWLCIATSLNAYILWNN